LRTGSAVASPSISIETADSLMAYQQYDDFDKTNADIHYVSSTIPIEYADTDL